MSSNAISGHDAKLQAESLRQRSKSKAKTALIVGATSGALLILSVPLGFRPPGIWTFIFVLAVVCVVISQFVHAGILGRRANQLAAPTNRQ
ncbi:hypothetical protein [Montanilutibacter psychrotolerans]|uniref:hypothetical protein n=1 Tax=Montanilutibacter psychrotolerans TaxID=1327343 RepID=UPI0011CDE608|nr:hypothetical protein [Lysobacter psychrotolerans]